jgi:hypothetical protein
VVSIRDQPPVPPEREPIATRCVNRHPLEKQADENPTAFLTLVGKIIPLQVTGKDGGPIQHQGINAPAKETREEWLARQAPAGIRQGH